jgi:hypothetical protein
LLAGKYRFTAQVQAVGTTLFEVDAEFRKNGTTYARQLGLVSGGAGGTGVSVVIDMNGSSDFVECWGLINGTGMLNFLGGTAPIRSWFEAEYIGP